MKELTEYIVKDLSSNCLEEIIKHGKYSIRGFRIGGRHSSMKRNMMESTLLQNTDKLLKTIREYANTQILEKKLDNLWTFPDEISEDTIKKKVYYGNKQNAVLELISNKRLDVLRDVYLLSDGQDDTITEQHEDLTENDGSDSESKIESLRDIIRTLEAEKKQLESTKLSLEQDRHILNEKIANMEDKVYEKDITIKSNRKKIKEVSTDLQDKNSEIQELKKEIVLKDELNVKLEQKISTMSILVFGERRTIEWFEHYNKNNKFDISCRSVGELNEINGLSKKFQEIWIIQFQLDKNGMNKILNSKMYEFYKSVKRLRVFDEFESVKEHMTKLEVII